MAGHFSWLQNIMEKIRKSDVVIWILLIGLGAASVGSLLSLTRENAGIPTSARMID